MTAKVSGKQKEFSCKISPIQAQSPVGESPDCKVSIPLHGGLCVTVTIPTLAPGYHPKFTVYIRIVSVLYIL